MNNQAASNAHAVLQYMISTALLRGKTGETTVRIPMTDMVTAFGESPTPTEDSKDIVLSVVIKTGWDAGTSDDVEIDMDEDIDTDGGFS